MTTPDELKFVAETLSAPPFSKSHLGLTAVGLHDDVPFPQLIQLLSDVCAHVDDANPTGNSSHRNVDVRQEVPEESVNRIGGFLRMLKFKPAADFATFHQTLLNGDRPLVLEALYFLLKDLHVHKKRAYLAPFLAAIDVPPEFMLDEGVADLNRQLAELQEQFINVHKYVDGIRSSGISATSIKREIQQMEEEKQQVLSKISKLKKRVEDIPNHDAWLEAAKNLRIEQQDELKTNERIKDQRNQISQAEAKYTNLQRVLKEIQSASGAGGSDVLFTTMEDDNKQKRAAKDATTKQVEETKTKLQELHKLVTEPTPNERDLAAMEKQIKELTESNAKLAERKASKTSLPADDKLALFRQQATIITRKKEEMSKKLATLTEDVKRMDAECERKQAVAKGVQGIKMLKGEDFKRYVSELRGKSNVYKRKKAELSELTAEFGVLQRTEEILKSREQSMQSAMMALHNPVAIATEISAQVAPRTDSDESKRKSVSELSQAVQRLTQNISEKKGQLAPFIQELRALRQQTQDLEAEYAEKKKVYDATMVGLDSEAWSLDQEVKGYRQDILNDQSRYHYLNMMSNVLEINNERVLQEMKAYIGGDETVEMQQRIRGFKTYRDMYNKRIAEQENLGKTYREQQKELKAKHEPSMKQLALFADVQKLLQLKVAHNKKLLQGGGKLPEDAMDGSLVTQDRLVL
ncbi:Intraflagellar transport protein 81 [Quaeritorhiza haematococci]|nr:Intraflagellar transport protein 81 [Quaeritorhiza haematococci]